MFSHSYEYHDIPAVSWATAWDTQQYDLQTNKQTDKPPQTNKKAGGRSLHPSLLSFSLFEPGKYEVGQLPYFYICMYTPF